MQAHAEDQLRTRRIVLVVSYDGTDFNGWADVSSRKPGSDTGGKRGRDRNRPPRTVGGVLGKHIRRLFNDQNIELSAASRTDAGVHAVGQVASFLVPTMLDRPSLTNVAEASNLDLGDDEANRQTKEVGKDKSVSARYWQPERMVHALNRMLPPDVRVTRATDTAAQDFSPTHDALGKEYRYMVDTSSFNRCDPNRRFFRWHLRSIAAADYNSNDQGCFRAATDKKICLSKSKLDGSLQAWLGPEVRRAADFLQGTHDFKAFRGAPRGSERRKERQLSSICTIESVDVRPLVYSLNNDTRRPYVAFDPDEHCVEVVVRGDRFLYHMVRNIVGALSEVARGERSPDAIASALAIGQWEHDSQSSDFGPSLYRKDTLKPICAPAHGLVLQSVLYDARSFDGEGSHDDEGTDQNTTAKALYKNSDSAVGETVHGTRDRKDNMDTRRSFVNSVLFVPASLYSLKVAPAVAADSLYSKAWFLGGGGGKMSKNRALVEVVRSRYKVDELEKKLLLASLAELENTPNSNSSVSQSYPKSRIESHVLGDARATVKTIVNNYHLYDAIKAASTSLPTSSKKVDGTTPFGPKNPQQAARDHGFAAVEFLAAIVEFDALDDLTNKGEGRLARTFTPEKLNYVLSAVQKARRELKAFAEAFSSDGSYEIAENYYRDLLASL